MLEAPLQQLMQYKYLGLLFFDTRGIDASMPEMVRRQQRRPQ